MKHIYSEKEKVFLKDNVKGITLKELTNRFNKKFNLNLTENAIGCRKNKLDLRSGITGGQFRKGQTPTNAIKKGQHIGIKTEFKKGNIPPNHRLIGSERITKDGYIEIKIQDGKLNKNWKLKHRYIYEKEKGTIPKGYKVVFADGNKMNLNLENLILVSYSEQLIMNRKKLFTTNKDLTKTGSIIAKVIDKTNKLRR